MRIMKIAAGDIRVSVDIDYANGTFRVTRIDNPNGEGCNSGHNARLLQDLMGADLPEFGEVEMMDAGFTPEGEAAKQNNRTKPLPFNPLKPAAPEKPNKVKPMTVRPEGQLDTGFGV